MDVETLARAQAVNRVAMGTGLMLAPGLVGRTWAASTARDPRAKVLSRALGARDLTLGLASLMALREGEQGWASRAFAAQAFADGVDFLAIASGKALPLGSRLVGGTLAAGSAAVAGAYARRLGSRAAPAGA
jgi:hypothetical protein